MPAKSRSSPKAVTPAEAILAEESQETCQVCQTEIEDNPNRYSFCLARCHNECMLNGVAGDICLSCGASQTQMELTDSQTPKLSTDTVQCSQTISTSSTAGPSVEEAQLTDHNKARQPQGLEMGNPVETTKESENQSGWEPQSATNNCQGVKLKTKDKKTSSDAQAVKHRELRQIEAKLKKWEEEFKLRETILNDKEVYRKKLEDYLQRTDARNVEQEATIRTLYRKISLLEGNGNQAPLSNGSSGYGMGPSPISVDFQHIEPNVRNRMQQNETIHNYNMPASKPNTQNFDLINGIQQQVTSFVLEKVKQQFDQLIMIDNALNRNVQHQFVAQQYPTPHGPNHVHQQTPQVQTVPQQQSSFSHQVILNIIPHITPLCNQKSRGDTNKSLQQILLQIQ